MSVSREGVQCRMNEVVVVRDVYVVGLVIHRQSLSDKGTRCRDKVLLRSELIPCDDILRFSLTLKRIDWLSTVVYNKRDTHPHGRLHTLFKEVRMPIVFEDVNNLSICPNRYALTCFNDALSLAVIGYWRAPNVFLNTVWTSTCLLDLIMKQLFSFTPI
jgi:hypothetical protein